MRVTLYFLLAVSAVIFTASCGAKSIKVSEIREACDKLPDFTRGGGRAAMEDISFDGYLVEAEPPSGTTSHVTIKDIDSDKTVELTFDVGNQNNQLQFTNKDNFTIKTSTGDVVKAKDKVRVLANMANSKFPQYNICSISALRIDKQ